MRGLHFALCFAVGGAFLPLCADAQMQQGGLPRLIRSGSGFGCEQTKEQLERSQRNGSANACGQVGPLALDMSRGEAEKVLGAPTTSKSFGTNTFYIYSLQVDEVAHMVTYAVVGYDPRQHVNSIQLTGLPWPGAWAFNDIKLGDTGKAVIARLGEPHGISPGRGNGTLVWDYLPWTFSFEIKGTIVSSIRVSE